MYQIVPASFIKKILQWCGDADRQTDHFWNSCFVVQFSSFLSQIFTLLCTFFHLIWCLLSFSQPFTHIQLCWEPIRYDGNQIKTEPNRTKPNERNVEKKYTRKSNRSFIAVLKHALPSQEYSLFSFIFISKLIHAEKGASNRTEPYAFCESNAIYRLILNFMDFICLHKMY